MLIQITNKCRMECTHCMQRSASDGKHMSMQTVDASVDFAQKSNAHVILISGGEPTEYPQFKEIVKKFLQFPVVLILTNGMWIDDIETIKTMRWLLSHKNVFMQVSHFSRYYPHEVNLKKMHILFPDQYICTDADGLNLLALGRTLDSPDLLEEAANSLGTTSCFSSALTAAQLPYPQSIQNMESRNKFCHPLIDWKGNLHWSESWLCPSFGNITEPFESLCTKAQQWRPCLGCPDAKKIFSHPDPKYKVASEILKLNHN